MWHNLLSMLSNKNKALNSVYKNYICVKKCAPACIRGTSKEVATVALRVEGGHYG